MSWDQHPDEKQVGRVVPFDFPAVKAAQAASALCLGRFSKSSHSVDQFVLGHFIEIRSISRDRRYEPLRQADGFRAPVDRSHHHPEKRGCVCSRPRPFPSALKREGPNTLRPRLASLVEQLAGCFCYAPAQVLGAGQIDFVWLEAAVGPCYGRSAIGCAAPHFVVAHLPGKAIIQSDNRHAEMQHVGDE